MLTCSPGGLIWNALSVTYVITSIPGLQLQYAYIFKDESIVPVLFVFCSCFRVSSIICRKKCYFGTRNKFI